MQGPGLCRKWLHGGGHVVSFLLRLFIWLLVHVVEHVHHGPGNMLALGISETLENIILLKIVMVYLYISIFILFGFWSTPEKAQQARISNDQNWADRRLVHKNFKIDSKGGMFPR